MRILVLSGGASKGSFQVGALKYILGELKTFYDAFCGVSVGAINAAFLSQFKHGEENLSSKELENLWKKVNTDNVYKRWFPFGRFHGLWKSSLYDSSPLLNLINSEISINKILSSNKTVLVGAVSLTSGKYKNFNQNHKDFIKAIMASSSFPGMFLPVEIDNELWSDGGIKEITPLQSAIDLGATQIDIIITSPKIDTSKISSYPSSLEIMKRAIDLMSDEAIATDIEQILFYNNLVNQGKAKEKRFIKLNIIRPDKNLTDNSLDFSHNRILQMMQIGYKIAKRDYFNYHY